MNTPVHKSTVSVTEAAEILGISRNLAYQAVQTGQIASVRIGRRLLIPMRALELLLNAALPDCSSSLSGQDDAEG